MVLPPRHGISLCSGGGGLDMGLELAEPRFASSCYVEWDPYPRRCLINAQRAGYLKPAPIWDNVQTFDARPWRGIDTVLAGYPCQPFSQAGQRKGEDDERHLWPDIERILHELGPELRWCFFENVSGHLTLGLQTVLDALRRLGFVTAAGIFSAEEVGATHERQRLFIVAHRQSGEGRGQLKQNEAERRWSRSARGCREVADPESGGGCLHTRSGTNGSRETLIRGTSAALEHAGGERRQQVARGAHGDESTNERWSAQYNHQPAGPSKDVADCEGRGCRERGDAPQSGCGRHADRSCVDMADPTLQRSQGKRADHCPSRWQEPIRSARLYGRTGIFPPRPDALNEWSAALDHAPNLAPALSISDVKRAADHFAQMVAQGNMAQAEAESFVRGMADGLAERTRRLRLLGNGVVPLQAAYAWRSLSAALGLGWVDLEAAGTDRASDGV